MEVCVTQHPAVVSDAGYELNEDTGPEEHAIAVESKVSGTENKIEAHKETECGPKTTLRPTRRIQVQYSDLGRKSKTLARWVICELKFKCRLRQSKTSSEIDSLRSRWRLKNTISRLKNRLK